MSERRIGIEASRLRSNEMHPVIYKAIVAVAFWMLLAVWSFFSDSGYTGLILATITAFTVIVVAIPYELWRLWRRSRNSLEEGREAPARPFRDWLKGELNIWQGSLRASDAAILVLTPLLAGAIGMTIFAIIFRIEI